MADGRRDKAAGQKNLRTRWPECSTSTGRNTGSSVGLYLDEDSAAHRKPGRAWSAFAYRAKARWDIPSSTSSSRWMKNLALSRTPRGAPPRRGAGPGARSSIGTLSTGSARVGAIARAGRHAFLKAQAPGTREVPHRPVIDLEARPRQVPRGGLQADVGVLERE